MSPKKKKNDSEDMTGESDFKDFAYQANPKRRTAAVIFILIVLIVIVGGGWLVLNKTLAGSEKNNKWYAVFMTNNQVYFGRIEKITKEDLFLSNIYYLQVVNTPLLQKEADAAAQQPELKLVKRGGELHGPADEMIINRDQVLLLEKLKDDSKVVAAIDDYRKNNK